MVRYVRPVYFGANDIFDGAEKVVSSKCIKNNHIVYDPVGFLSPIMIQLKFQEICISEVQWDDLLSYFIEVISDPIEKIYLHGDSSKIAYGLWFISRMLLEVVT